MSFEKYKLKTFKNIFPIIFSQFCFDSVLFCLLYSGYINYSMNINGTYDDVHEKIR